MSDSVGTIKLLYGIPSSIHCITFLSLNLCSLFSRTQQSPFALIWCVQALHWRPCSAAW